MINPPLVGYQRTNSTITTIALYQSTRNLSSIFSTEKEKFLIDQEKSTRKKTYENSSIFALDASLLRLRYFLLANKKEFV